MDETQHTFTEISQEIADDFLSTIVFIDECAYKQAPENDNDLDAKAVTDAFAKKGKICSVFAPEKASDLDNICSMLFKADAIVLDWKMNIVDDNANPDTNPEADADIDDESGKYTIQIIQNFLKDAEKGKVKLVVVYTSEIDLENKILQPIYSNISYSYKKINVSNFEIRVGDFKIVIRSKYEEGKYNYMGESMKKFMVKYEELPDLIVNEFSSLTTGLLPNFALQSITEIRNSTSKILGVFSKDLDPAFLGHCSLTCIDDGAELLSEVFGTAITELIDTSSINLNEWVNRWIEQISSTGKKIKLKDVKNNQSGKPTENTTRIDVSKDLLANIIVGNFKNIKDTSNKIYSDKNAPKHASGFYCLNGESEDKTNQLFAQLTQNKDLFSIKPVAPELTQGAILKDEQDCYWLCVSPACDCARIGAEGRFFLFVPLLKSEEKKSSPIIISEDCVVYPSMHPFDIKVFFFEKKHIVPFYTYQQKYCFLSGQHIFEWVLTLKRLYAQRITEKLSSQMSRVGLNISEWLRTKGNDKD
ncbi:MAG: response regulator receiver domain [Bacteroidales bacterium]|nr:response regulator receiver domain [Bacteroidales bacterium]